MSGKDELRKARKGYEGYLKYMGLGFTLLGIVLAFTFGGYWLDKQLHWAFPVFTLAGSLLGIAGAMVYLFQETKPRG